MSSTRAPERPAVLLEARPHDVAILPGVELGDLLCAVPAIRALRAALPESRIGLVGLLWARQLMSRFPQYLDDFIALPADDANFELVIRLDGPSDFPLAFGKTVAGYARRGAPARDHGWLMPYPDNEPEIRRHLRLVAWLGGEILSEELEFPVTHDDELSLATVTRGLDIEPGRYVCLYPGSRNSLRWPADRFASVGDCLVRRGLRVVLIGTRAEAELTARVAGMMRESAVDLGGKTRLGTLAALLAGARLMVGNDSAAAHLAQALNVPSVVLFAPSDVLRWGPLDRNQHRVLCPAARTTPTQVMRCAESFLGMQSLRRHRSPRPHQALYPAP